MNIAWFTLNYLRSEPVMGYTRSRVSARDLAITPVFLLGPVVQKIRFASPVSKMYHTKFRKINIFNKKYGLFMHLMYVVF